MHHESSIAMHASEQLVDIGGRLLAIVYAGAGSPVVVLESGLGAPSDGWVPVQTALAHDARVCRYNRAGRGQSDPCPTPRTATDMVTDLRHLLHAAGIAPPYVLVGHSVGGMNARMYAHLHPAEVVGLILVDPTHQDQFERIGPLLPPIFDGASEQFRTARRVWAEGGWRDASCNAEGVDLVAIGQEMNTIHSLGDLPLRVLVSGHFLSLVPQRDVARRLHEKFLELQQDLARLSSRSRLMVVEESAFHSSRAT